VAHGINDGTEKVKHEIKIYFKESDPCTNKTNEKTKANNMANNIASTTQQIKENNHEPTTATLPITNVQIQNLNVEESSFIHDSLFPMNFQSCLASQVQDTNDKTSATYFGSYEIVEQDNQQYLNPELENGLIEFDLLNSNIVSEKDPDLFPGGYSNLFGTYKTQPTLEKLSTYNGQLPIVRSDTRNEEYFFQEKSSKSAKDNFNPSSSDENNIIETENAEAAINAIPVLHLTEDTPNFDPTILINDIEMDLGDNTFVPGKSPVWIIEGHNNTMMTLDPVWTDPSNDPIPDPQLILAGCGDSVLKVEGLKQRVRCG